MSEKVNYSEDTQAILGRIPGWIIRWGILVVFCIFAGLLIICYFIKYPQTIVAPIVITTDNPPVDLISRSSGRIDSIYVTNGFDIPKEGIVAMLYTTADYEAVKRIKMEFEVAANNDILNSVWMDDEQMLGDLQSYYLDFKRKCLDYKYYLNANNIEKKKRLINDQIAKSKELYTKQLSQQKLLQEENLYEKKSFERDSLLALGNVISASEYEQSVKSFLQKQSSLRSFEAGLTSTELNILQMEQQLIELSIQQTNEIAEYERSLNQSRQQLLAQIEQWQYQYLITSPIKGKISLTKYWMNNQTIQSGERLATVIPDESSCIVGRMTVPSQGFGKVEKGQTVNIKLSGFPHMEYGMIKGVVSNISQVPEADGYVIEVNLPHNLTTTYNKKIDLIHRMDGTGEIITKDQNLLQRFTQPIRALFDK